MMPIIRWTIWQRRWSVMWWSIGVAGFIILTLIFYPTFKDQAAQLQKSFNELPSGVVQLSGGSSDFFSPVGFLNSQIFFIMLPLLLGILGIGMGSNVIGREEQDKTIEALLARPLSRGRLLAAKALAGTSILATVSLISLIVTIAIAKAVGLEVAAGDIALATVSCFLLSLSVSAIAFLLSATGRARGASIGLAALISLLGYIVSSLAGTVHWLQTPAKVFPFHYYGSEAILRHTYDWTSALFFVAILILCGVGSWLSFRRRDIA